jgi:hypothetical protein
MRTIIPANGMLGLRGCLHLAATTAHARQGIELREARAAVLAAGFASVAWRGGILNDACE